MKVTADVKSGFAPGCGCGGGGKGGKTHNNRWLGVHTR